jgi:uncharacterized protein YndB with AHSA1/START domain
MATSQKSKGLDGATFRSHRVLPYQPESVFAAFARPELLAHWWGPNGFTNTFEVFEFRLGGRWKFVMHGPDGSNHPNESVFLELHDPSKLVIQHVSPPCCVLTVTLAAHEAGTVITWAQEFEDRAVAARIRHIVEPANEQNLDRLQSRSRSSITVFSRSASTQSIGLMPSASSMVTRRTPQSWRREGSWRSGPLVFAPAAPGSSTTSSRLFYVGTARTIPCACPSRPASSGVGR